MEVDKKLVAGIIITLLAAMSGTYFAAQDANAYHCESRDMVMICERLSSGIGTRCYFIDAQGDSTYKVCKEGWVSIEIGQEINTTTILEVEVIPVPSEEGFRWECSHEECVRIS